MTRPGHVSVEFPIEEAEGIVLRLAPDGTKSMSGAQCIAAQRGRERLKAAVRVETQPGGSCCDPDGASLPTGQTVGL